MPTSGKIIRPRSVTFRQQSNQFMLRSTCFQGEGLPGLGSSVHYFPVGVGVLPCVGLSTNRCVEQLARVCSDGAAACLFVRTPPSRTACEAAPSSLAWRVQRALARVSIPQTRRTIFARSARRSISPRRRSCRVRRSCRCRLHRERSSISAISRPFLSRRNARHFNRALLPSPDSRSLLI